MGLIDKLSAGAERATKEAGKAFEKGKTKVGELQIELQMDGVAKKLGYLVFDFYRGREVDQAQRQKLLDDLSRLEDQLFQVRAETAAKAGGAAHPAPAPTPVTEVAPAPVTEAAPAPVTEAPSVSGQEPPRSDAAGSRPQGDA